MSHPLTIEVPESVYRPLERWAARLGKTPEDLACEWVARRVLELEDDALLKWAGAIDSAPGDVAERHDEYLGRNLAGEPRGQRP
jgi:hypothetical protein